MKDEYDFSSAERGRFFRPDVTLSLPVYLDPANQRSVEALAARQNKDVNALVNELLRSDKRLADLSR